MPDTRPGCPRCGKPTAFCRCVAELMPPEKLYQHCCGCRFVSLERCGGCLCHERYRTEAGVYAAGTPHLVKTVFRAAKPEDLAGAPMRWDAVSDPVADVMGALDDMAAHGYGETAMRMAERLGLAKPPEEDG